MENLVRMNKATQSGFNVIAIVLAVAVILVAGLVAWRMLYSGQHIQNQPATPNTNQKTTDELVIDAAREYCTSKAPAGTQTDFTVGKIGANSKAVVYSADGNFAKANIRCVLSGLDGGAIEYVLGKKNANWDVLYADIEENPAKAQQFGIPANFE